MLWVLVTHRQQVIRGCIGSSRKYPVLPTVVVKCNIISNLARQCHVHDGYWVLYLTREYYARRYLEKKTWSAPKQVTKVKKTSGREGYARKYHLVLVLSPFMWQGVNMMTSSVLQARRLNSSSANLTFGANNAWWLRHGVNDLHVTPRCKIGLATRMSHITAKKNIIILFSNVKTTCHRNSGFNSLSDEMGEQLSNRSAGERKVLARRRPPWVPSLRGYRGWARPWRATVQVVEIVCQIH